MDNTPTYQDLEKRIKILEGKIIELHTPLESDAEVKWSQMFDFLDEINQIGGDLGLVLQKPSGNINARVNISGMLNQPKLMGEIALTQGKLKLPELGLTLDPIQLTLKTDGTTWESHGLIQSNHSEPFILNAQGTITPDFTGSAVFAGNHVIIMDTPE